MRKAKSKRPAVGRHSASLDRDEKLILRRAAAYLGRVLERFPHLDQEALELVFWILGEEAGELSAEAEALVGEGKVRDELVERLKSQSSDSDVASALAQALRRSPRAVSERLLEIVRDALGQRSARLRYRGRSDTERAIARARQMLGLDEREVELCFFLYLMACWPRVEAFFDDHLKCAHPPGRKYAAAALGLNNRALGGLLRGKLSELGIIDTSSSWITLSSEYYGLFAGASEAIDAQRSYRAAPRPAVELEHHLVQPARTEHLLALLREPHRKHSTHVLIYGPPGTGKTSYARGLAARLGCPAYEVLPDEDTRGVSHRMALVSCLNMTQHGERPALVIVDEADSLLESARWHFRAGSLRRGAEGNRKGWLNHLLDGWPRLRMIWVCNEVEEMDPSVRRRFAFSVAFDQFGRRQRLQLWRSVARAHRVRRLLRPTDIEALATSYKLGAGAVDIAVRSAKQAAPRSRAVFLEVLRATLEAHQTLLAGGVQQAPDKDAVNPGFCLEVLNADTDVGQLLRRLAHADRALRARAEHSCQAGGLNVLLHGPPGTGKSELARYVAHRLDREPLVRRASDLLSKWLGDNERNLAQAFAEAERDDAVLILDEVDSLLYARQRDQKSWEISAVNELLTQMERFRGILFCTTNRLDGLDPAALRRFQIKTKLDYLRPEGKRLLYQRLLAPRCAARLRPATLDAVAALGPLSPGDFRVVADQHRFEPAPSHHALVVALGQEAALRSQRRGRVVGFA